MAEQTTERKKKPRSPLVHQKSDDLEAAPDRQQIEEWTPSLHAGHSHTRRARASSS